MPSIRHHGPVTPPIALPSRDDPDVSALSRWIGGPVGRFADVSTAPRRALRIALALTFLVLALGFAADQPCRDAQWASRDESVVWAGLCYSDVPFLYRERGFADGALPYRESALEYPVLTGAVMQASGWAVRTFGGDGSDALDQSVRFYDVTTVLMVVCALVVVAATARTVPRRPWDGVLVALSPLLLLSATVNWDLLAVALASLAVYAWTRDRPASAGVLIGLGTAAKLYPMLLLGPMFLVALRAPDRREALWRFAVTAGSAVLAWSAVNIPVMLWAPDGWRAFFSFNSDRGADFGSVWYALELLRPGVLPDDIDLVVVVVAVVLLAFVVALALNAPEPPRLAQLAFLAVAAFLLVNKVWSPQYSLWLLPLAVLARPRWRDLLVWQAVEVGYFVAVWWYLGTFYGADAPAASGEVYAWAILLRAAAVVWFASRVVGDVLRPARDPVRPYVEVTAR